MSYGAALYHRLLSVPPLLAGHGPGWNPGNEKKLDKFEGRPYYRPQAGPKEKTERQACSDQLGYQTQNRESVKKNNESDYLFVNLQTETRYTKIHNSWNGILKKAGLKGKPGIDKLRFHDLRHTAATSLARAGKDMRFIAQDIGHTDVKT